MFPYQWRFGSGTRFRPLSFSTPEPLFPLAGQPMVHHHISACKRVRFRLIFEGSDCLWLMLLCFIQSVWECGRFLVHCLGCNYAEFDFVLKFYDSMRWKIRVLLWLMIDSVQIPNLVQVFLVGYYNEREFALYCSSVSNELKVPVRWLSWHLISKGSSDMNRVYFVVYDDSFVSL